MQPYSKAILANSTQHTLLGKLSTTTKKIMAQLKRSPLWVEGSCDGWLLSLVLLDLMVLLVLLDTVM